MPFVGSIIPFRAVWGDAKARRAKRARDDERAENPGSFKRTLDEAELTVGRVEATETTRTVKGNEQEESHEDRVEHTYYRPGASAPAPASEPPRKLDLEG
jgi:hypothetical protein